jgi:hypothetical protein
MNMAQESSLVLSLRHLGTGGHSRAYSVLGLQAHGQSIPEMRISHRAVLCLALPER